MLSDVWYDIECCKSLNIIKQLCPRDILTDKLQLLCVGSCTANLKTKRNHQKQTSMYFFCFKLGILLQPCMVHDVVVTDIYLMFTAKQILQLIISM